MAQTNGVAKPADIPNKAAKVSYFTPAQEPPSGTATNPQPNGQAIPKLFQPLKVRDLTFQNRIVLSPLCQYSAEDGHHTAWHMAHLGGIISRGPGLSFVEATSVTAAGRITPEDSGLWKDSQIEPLRRIVDFAHSQSQHIGIQLAHAGRKASTVAPWLAANKIATEAVNGWPNDVWAPSEIPYNEDTPMPKAMTRQDIEDLKTAWAASVQRAVKAGFDLIEIHNAHGYLLFSFLSPQSNHRTDEYGGSWENRTRLTKEIVKLTRDNMPNGMPLMLRISSSEWLEEVPEVGESWKIEDTVRLADEIADMGVDIIDCSSGGNHPKQKSKPGPGYQVPFAKAVKDKLGDRMIVSTVGSITEAKQANGYLEEGLDLVSVGRYFQKNPGLVWAWAEELGIEINVANQIRWGFGGRPGAPKKG